MGISRTMLVMGFDVVTLFATMSDGVTHYGVTRRAHEQGLWQLQLWNPRDFTSDNYRTVDDRPYGGGPGMVMLAAPLESAIDAARRARQAGGYSAAPVIHLSPQGSPLTERKVLELAAGDGLILLATRYEGGGE